MDLTHGNETTDAWRQRRGLKPEGEEGGYRDKDGWAVWSEISRDFRGDRGSGD